MKENVTILVENAQRGDIDAFGKLVEMFQDAVFGGAWTVTRNFHDAEDIAQEAFLLAYRELPRLRAPEKFPGWLRRITTNACVSFMRSRSKAHSDLAAVMNTPMDRPDPDTAAESNELKEKVLEAIGALSKKNRLVTTLYFIDGYSHREISDFLEIPVSTVKSRLYESRKKLQGRLMKMAEDMLHKNKPGAEFVDDVRDRMKQEAAGALNDWLYPGMRYTGGGHANDLRFIHAQYETTDSLEQVREFYWKKCEWTHDRRGEVSIYGTDRYPKRIFRNGPPIIVVYATEERTISILGVPQSEERILNLYFTLEVRAQKVATVDRTSEHQHAHREDRESMDQTPETQIGAEKRTDNTNRQRREKEIPTVSEDAPRILVVDKDRRTLDFMSETLTKEGFRVDAVEDGKTAQEKVRTNQYHLVLTEVKVPGASYVEIIKAVQEDSPSTGVLVITSSGTVEDAVEAMRKGAYDYIPKPCSATEIELVVGRALEHQSLLARVQASEPTAP